MYTTCFVLQLGAQACWITSLLTRWLKVSEWLGRGFVCCLWNRYGRDQKQDGLKWVECTICDKSWKYYSLRWLACQCHNKSKNGTNWSDYLHQGPTPNCTFFHQDPCVIPGEYNEKCWKMLKESVSMMSMFAYGGHIEAQVLNWACFVTILKFLVVRLQNPSRVTNQLGVHLQFIHEHCERGSTCCPWIQDGSYGCCLEDGRTDGGRRHELERLTVLRSDQF